MTRDELQRVIDAVVKELLAATSRPGGRCGCHGVLEDCCPDRLSGVIDAGASRVGVHASGGAPPGGAGGREQTPPPPPPPRRHKPRAPSAGPPPAHVRAGCVPTS